VVPLAFICEELSITDRYIQLRNILLREVESSDLLKEHMFFQVSFNNTANDDSEIALSPEGFFYVANNILSGFASDDNLNRLRKNIQLISTADLAMLDYETELYKLSAADVKVLMKKNKGRKPVNGYNPKKHLKAVYIRKKLSGMFKKFLAITRNV
jgi:hypothetical protein